MIQPNYLHLLKKLHYIPPKPKIIQNQITLPDIMDINDYKIINEIGSGSYSTVYLVKELSTDRKFAMKKSIANDLEEVEKIKQEILLVSYFKHPNVVPILKYLVKQLDSTTYVVYLLMPLSLCDWSQEIPNRTYTQSELMSILSQLVAALSLFQRNNVAHRDIKPQNIFIYDNGKYSLADFDEIIKLKSTDHKKEFKVTGTELFMSPLLHTAAREGSAFIKHNVFKSDVFSLGLCMIYAITSNYDLLSYIQKSNDFMNEKMLKKYFNKYGYDYSNEFINVLLRMIKKDEKDRYDFIELSKVLEKITN